MTYRNFKHDLIFIICKSVVFDSKLSSLLDFLGSFEPLHLCFWLGSNFELHGHKSSRFIGHDSGLLCKGWWEAISGDFGWFSSLLWTCLGWLFSFAS